MVWAPEYERIRPWSRKTSTVLMASWIRPPGLPRRSSTTIGAPRAARRTAAPTPSEKRVMRITRTAPPATSRERTAGWTTTPRRTRTVLRMTAPALHDQVHRPAVGRLQRGQRGLDVAAYPQPVDRQQRVPGAQTRTRGGRARDDAHDPQHPALLAHAHAHAVEALGRVGPQRRVLRGGQIARERVAQLLDQLRHRSCRGQRVGVEIAHVTLCEHLAHRIRQHRLARRRRRDRTLAPAPRRVAKCEREHHSSKYRNGAAQAHVSVYRVRIHTRKKRRMVTPDPIAPSSVPASSRSGASSQNAIACAPSSLSEAAGR